MLLLQKKKKNYIVPYCFYKKALKIKTLKEKKKISDKNQNLEKNSILEKVFFLKKSYKINLFLLNISKLLSGNYFVVFSYILRNRLSVKLKALINSEANKSVFINTCAIDVTKYF